MYDVHSDELRFFGPLFPCFITFIHYAGKIKLRKITGEERGKGQLVPLLMSCRQCNTGSVCIHPSRQCEEDACAAIT